MYGKPSYICALNFQFFRYHENIEKNIGIPLLFLVLEFWTTPHVMGKFTVYVSVCI